MILVVIISLLPITFKLINNYQKWIDREKVNHRKEFWLMVAAYIVPGIMFYQYTTINYILSALIIIGMIGFWFWFLFDSIYNVIRGFKMWFTGSDDKDDAYLDNFLQSLKLWQHVAIKTGGILIFTTLYYLIV